MRVDKAKSGQDRERSQVKLSQCSAFGLTILHSSHSDRHPSLPQCSTIHDQQTVSPIYFVQMMLISWSS